MKEQFVVESYLAPSQSIFKFKHCWNIKLVVNGGPESLREAVPNMGWYSIYHERLSFIEILSSHNGQRRILLYFCGGPRFNAALNETVSLVRTKPNLQRRKLSCLVLHAGPKQTQ